MHEWKTLAFTALTTVCLIDACATGDEARHMEPPQATAAQVTPVQDDGLAAALAAYAAATPCDSDGTCWLNPLPRGYYLRAVAGTGPNDVWLAGEGDALHFDGEKVRGHPTGLGPVYALWSASPTDVWAVGGKGAARFDGTKFTLVMPAESYALEGGVWGTSADDVYVAVDGLKHWDGRTWTKIPDVRGRVISGSGPNDVWVAGAYDGCWHYDGNAWSQVPEPAAVTSVLVRAPNDVWMVTQERYVHLHHFDGTQWTNQELRQGPDVGGLIQHGDGHMWASGQVARYDGTSWTRASAATSGALAALGDTLISVSSGGRIQRITNTSPPMATDLTVGPYETLSRVWASSGADAWAVGRSGTALHYDGKRAQAVDTGVREDLSDLSGTARDDVWAVGRGGVIVHWDGARWTRVDGQTKSSLLTVFPAARNDAWIGSTDGVLLHATPGGATRVALAGLPERASILDIAGVAADDIWIAGSSGANGQVGWLAHFDGTAWSPVLIPKDVPESRALTRITAHASNDVWIEAQSMGKRVYDYSLHWDGTRWTAVWAVPWGAPRLTEKDFATGPTKLDYLQLVVDGKLFQVGSAGRFTYRLADL